MAHVVGRASRSACRVTSLVTQPASFELPALSTSPPLFQLFRSLMTLTPRAAAELYIDMNCPYQKLSLRSHSTPSTGSGNTTTTGATGSTVSPKETKKFAALADQWWDMSGPFKPLHQLNPARCRFIKSVLCDKYNLDTLAPLPLSSLNVLDVGCGGGILAEALARMGAHVDGIDATAEGPAAAAAHAQQQGDDLSKRLCYRTATVEDIAAAGERYNVVIASEVIEHVASIPDFCNALVSSTQPGGTVILSTINRSMKAYALAVVAAEHVLRMVPQGTHDWSKFVTPEELALAMQNAGAGPPERAAGMEMDIVRGGMWDLTRDLSMNYIMSFGVRGGGGR